MPPVIGPRRQRLATRLREVRAGEFASGSALARALGWQQSRVSKIETGAQLPSKADLTEWVTASGASADVEAELRELLTAARLEYRSFGDAWSQPGGMSASQAAILAENQAATRIAEYQPAVVPGLGQTPEYAREALLAPASAALVGATEAGADDLVRDRMQQQNAVLYTRGKRIQLVMGEAALRTWFDNEDTLRGQRDRLVTLAGLDTIELGIVPFSMANPLPGFSGFALLDTDTVYVETLTGEQRIDAPDEVASYVKALDIVLASALKGADAVEFIRAIR